MGTVSDLLIVGAGINGAGIARDAAGRKLSVTLVEKDDIASATSSWSSKLIHGGLRYLEQYEFRLVRESLSEREVLLRLAPHLIRPMMFVLPHDRSMRPVWMIRVGLWMYDHIGGKITLPGSKAVTFPHLEYSAGLKTDYHDGFVYSDCRVDDARLTLANVVDAREKGATVLTRTKLVSAKRVGPVWEATLEDRKGATTTLQAKAIVNAGGPWVMDVLDSIPGARAKAKGNVRLVKGSHIIVPKVHSLGHAYILQNPDKRVIFVIPYEGKFSLIGTTDVPVNSVAEAREISEPEVDYLLAAVNRYLAKPLTRADVVSSYAGVRPLFDDGQSDPSAITRDYVLTVDDESGHAPLISLFGGKITTYRCLAETVMQKLSAFFPGMGPTWTSEHSLPGGDIPHFNGFRDEMHDKYAGLGRDLLEGMLRRHGSRAERILDGAKGIADLGRHFGGGLTEREVAYMLENEWAVTAEDILTRRTKCGLHMSDAERTAFAEYLSTR
jgi:glycerol-3-phosphate dehydrogenase